MRFQPSTSGLGYKDYIDFQSISKIQRPQKTPVTLPKIPRDACDTSKDTQRSLENLEISKDTQRCLETFDTSKDTQQCFERSSKDTWGCLGNWSFYKDTWRAWSNPGRQNMLWDLWNYLEQLEFLQVQTPFSWWILLGIEMCQILWQWILKSKLLVLSCKLMRQSNRCVFAKGKFVNMSQHWSFNILMRIVHAKFGYPILTPEKHIE